MFRVEDEDVKTLSIFWLLFLWVVRNLINESGLVFLDPTPKTEFSQKILKLLQNSWEAMKYGKRWNRTSIQTLS